MLPNGTGIGNRAVAALVAQRARAQVGVVQRLPADTNVGERVQHLREAIKFETLMYRFIIDEGKAADALENMTEDEGRQVKAEYKTRAKYNLGWIFSAVETPLEDGPPASNNLSMASRTKLLNLLAGTREPTPPPAAEPAPAPAPAPEAPAPRPGQAGPAAAGAAAAAGPGSAAPPAAKPAAKPDPEKMRKRRQRVLAASIRRAIEKKDAEAAISLIPASMDERREIDALYQSMYGKTAYMELFTKLPGKDGARAGALWYDEKDEADRYAVEAGVEARNKAEKEAKALEASPLGSALGDAAKAKRQEGDKKLEAAVRKVANSGDQTTVKGKAASRERLDQIVKAVERGEGRAMGGKYVGLRDDPVLKAIAEGNEADEIGARLARADSIKDVPAAEIESALREVRAAAEEEADRQINSVKEGETVDAEALTKAIVDGYFARFKAAFNHAQKRRSFREMLAGRSGNDEKVASAMGFDVDTLHDVVGGRAEIDRNMALMNTKGQIDEVSELVFALASKPKDIERVRGILSAKTSTQIDALALEYHSRTGKSLQEQVAGTAVEQKAAQMFNESREDVLDKRDMLVGGQWDRELAASAKNAPPESDPVTREAYFLKSEGDFWYRKAGRLADRVVANRGLFARARDWSGNDEKEILDTAREDVAKAYTALNKALAPGKAAGPQDKDDPGGSGPDLAAARTAVAELRVISRRMSHATTIYKESTKKAYEEFVDLVVNAASIAAGLGVTGIWITALRTTAATVGTKLVMKGGDYTADEFLSDLEGGMAGVAGDFAKLGMNKLVTPYVASKIMRLAGKLGMSAELRKQVAAKIGPLALRQAEHTVGTAASNIAQGKSWKEGQGWVDRAKGEIQGQITAPISEHIENRKKAGYGGESDGIPKPIDDENGAPARSSGARRDAEEGALSSADGRAAADAESPRATAEPGEAPPPVPMALPEPVAALPKRNEGPAPIQEGEQRPKGRATDDPAATKLAKGEAPPPKPKPSGEEERAPFPTEGDGGGPGGTGPSVEDLARNFVQPDLTPFMPAMSKNHSGETVVLSNVLVHPDIEAQVKVPDLLSELDRTPYGEQIADRIRDGRLQIVIMPSGNAFPLGGIHFTGGKTYIGWGGDMTLLASNALHEGAHFMDPATTVTTNRPRDPSRRGIEAEARAWEYEYNELAGRRPRQPVEEAFRDAYERVVRRTAGMFRRTKQNPHGADLALARREADKAMVKALQDDPTRYGVEDVAAEEARLANRRDPDFLSNQIDNLLPPLPPVPDHLEIESMFGGDEPEGSGGQARRPSGAAAGSEGQNAPPRPDQHGQRPATREGPEAPGTSGAGGGRDPFPTEAGPTGSSHLAQDSGLVGDKKNPGRKAKTLPERAYEAADRPVSQSEEAAIATRQEEMRVAILAKLQGMESGKDAGYDASEFARAKHALERNPGKGSNDEVLKHVDDIWEAVHDPKLLADVLSRMYGESLRRPGSGSGLDPLTKAILREAAVTGPIHVAPPRVMIEDPEFFIHWVSTGRRWLDLGAPQNHGQTIHLIQDLVVDAYLQQKGSKITAQQFRALLRGIQVNSSEPIQGQPGNRFWISLFDASVGINTPEKVIPALRLIPGLEGLN